MFFDGINQVIVFYNIPLANILIKPFTTNMWPMTFNKTSTTNTLLFACVLKSIIALRVRQLAYVAYVIGVRMILDMCTFDTYAHLFPWFFKVFKNFSAIFLTFICLSLEETDSLLFTYVLKKIFFSIFHTNYLINILY